jgi:hypothetical protein
MLRISLSRRIDPTPIREKTMSREDSSLLTAHKVAVGVSVFSVVAAVVSLIGATIEILSGPAWAMRWAAGGVIVATSLAWLLAVLRHGHRSRGFGSGSGRRAEADERRNAAKENQVLGYVSLLLLVLGCGLVGWNVNAAFASADGSPPTPSTSSAPSAPSPPSGAKGVARITSPHDAQEVKTCTVAVRIEGSPARGKAFMAVTKQRDAAYYFEPEVEQVRAGEWSASVQLGQRKVTEDENYTIIVYELDEGWIAYLRTMLANAAKDWGVSREVDATYWNTMSIPPAAAEVHRVNLHRARHDDSTCPS